jgi:hypothetical protein
MRHCPVGWLYGEFLDDESPERGPYVLVVCSNLCAGNFWIQGPGDLKTSPSYIRMPKANMDVEEGEEPLEIER